MSSCGESTVIEINRTSLSSRSPNRCWSRANVFPITTQLPLHCEKNTLMTTVLSRSRSRKNRSWLPDWSTRIVFVK